MWDTIIIQPFINALLFIYRYLGQNFGIAIILFTILIRVISLPLTLKQMKSSQAMQKMNSDPRWLKIQEKYKDDREKLAQEQMAFYKEAGVSPFSSCLPTLIQFPIILGLYQSIIRTMAQTPMQMFELTKYIYANIFNVSELLPLNSQFLWMNLGQPDRIEVSFLPFAIPVMAILVAVTSYLQSKLMTPPTAGDANDQSAQMSKMMGLYMPLFMGYLAYTLASGLALYFVVSNVIGILQYALMGNVNWENLLPKKWAAALRSKEDK
ncbi:MAG: YidC/Oxa1 family membrane protein insertase [Anaerolineaceae bacterium]|nr:YidC/Oxa1 family membrane protein insertase [Anaerolineaceae bacterium]